MVDYNFREIEEKWHSIWRKERVFEPEIDQNKKSFFINVPIPYPSGSLHLGHFYTWTRADIYARFMRMRGFNVLFPQGFHLTGGPIVGVAKRVKEKDPETLEFFKKQGVSDSELEKFSDNPYEVATYFCDTFRSDFENMGMSIDWRKLFITTSLNPHFSKFVQWQFNKLRSLGLITEGRHPVVWCPKENTPLGDHDRSEGEGESPQKFTIIKFRSGDIVLPAATLRPETIFGATNIWINDSKQYSIVEVNGERWVVASDSIAKLSLQIPGIKRMDNISPKTLLNMEAINPVNGEKIPILGAGLVDTEIGTGVVMSVPMHAPFDFYYFKKAGLKIKPKKVIDVVGDDNIVEDAIKRFGETDGGLKEATRFVYKKEFNTGVMNSMAGDLSGLQVKDVDEPISDLLRSKGAYSEMYELTGKVVCRCGAKGVVSVLEKQWFIRYSDKEWKTKTRKLIERMNIYPEDARLQFLNTLEWLGDKGAARKGGLGTPLPWDSEWIIEPLSDSTIYMAYYTIADKIEKIPLESIDDGLFDFIFYGKDDGKETYKKKFSSLREGFMYWYPVDLRLTAKELLQNHMMFFLMNHTAIFGEEHWPRGMEINGWLTVGKEKLSKSKGATLTVKKGLEMWGIDQLRMIATAGNGMDDVEWDPVSVNAFSQRIRFVLDTVEGMNIFGDEKTIIDRYLISKMNRIIAQATSEVEAFRYGNAISSSFFGMYNEFRLYLELGGRNKSSIQRFLSVFVGLNHPFFPHITEEINRRLGNKELLESSAWPSQNIEEIDDVLENEIESLINTVEDIKNIIKLIKKKPEKIQISLAGKDKFDIYNTVARETKNSKNVIEIRRAIKLNSKVLDKLLKNPDKLPVKVLDINVEMEVFEESVGYLEKTFDCKVKVERNSEEDKAMPGKPAIKIV